MDGLEDLKDINIFHKDFPNEQMGVKENRERARGVLRNLEERYEAVDEKITNFASLPEEIKVVLDKYIDTKLRKSMNVEPVQLNMREASKPYACFSCRPTPVHYRETAAKLVQDLLDQRV